VLDRQLPGSYGRGRGRRALALLADGIPMHVMITFVTVDHEILATERDDRRTGRAFATLFLLTPMHVVITTLTKHFQESTSVDRSTWSWCRRDGFGWLLLRNAVTLGALTGGLGFQAVALFGSSVPVWR